MYMGIEVSTATKKNMHLLVVPPIPGAWWGIGEELTCCNGTSPPYLGHNPFLYIFLTNTQYFLVVHSVWQGDKGVSEIHQEFKDT